MRTDLASLFQSLARLLDVPHAADEDFGRDFNAMMRALVSFDHMVAFAYRGEGRPVDVYSSFSADDYEIFVSLYQAGPYLLDPFYVAVREGRHGFRRMRELAPDRFFSSEYFRTYYIQTGLAEEVGFFVALDGDITIALSLMRGKQLGAFSGPEIALLRQAEVLVSGLIRRQYEGLADRFDRLARQRGGRSRLKDQPVANKVWSKLGLTGREAAIIDLVLQGHSSESIGLKLEIATGTVKVHRRNVYRKLRISSQIQLLSIYVNTIKANE